MKKIIKAHKEIFKNRKLFYVIVVLLAILIFCAAYFVKEIKDDIFNALLTVVSILFPLIAGFLTFGRETVAELNDKIIKSKNIDKNKKGRPIPDSVKREINRNKALAKNFKSIVINTFFISFILIMAILVSKIIGFNYTTVSFDYTKIELKTFLGDNIINLILKTVLFSILTMLFLNLSYLVFFIIKVFDE